MHWFDESHRMGWLVIFWIASFLLFMGMFWLLSRSNEPKKPRQVRRSPRVTHQPPQPRPSA
jgi:hypothetical protein